MKLKAYVRKIVTLLVLLTTVVGAHVSHAEVKPADLVAFPDIPKFLTHWDRFVMDISDALARSLVGECSGFPGTLSEYVVSPTSTPKEKACLFPLAYKEYLRLSSLLLESQKNNEFLRLPADFTALYLRSGSWGLDGTRTKLKTSLNQVVVDWMLARELVFRAVQYNSELHQARGIDRGATGLMIEFPTLESYYRSSLRLTRYYHYVNQMQCLMTDSFCQQTKSELGGFLNQSLEKNISKWKALNKILNVNLKQSPFEMDQRLNELVKLDGLYAKMISLPTMDLIKVLINSGASVKAQYIKKISGMTTYDIYSGGENIQLFLAVPAIHDIFQIIVKNYPFKQKTSLTLYKNHPSLEVLSGQIQEDIEQYVSPLDNFLSKTAEDFNAN